MAIFGIFDSQEEKVEKARKKMELAAKDVYKKCQNSDESDLREKRLKQVKAALKSRNHLDAAFIAGAKDYEQIQTLHPGVTLNELDNDKLPKAAEYNRSSNKEGDFFTWIPYKFTEKMYDLGRQYQASDITEETALAAGQGIANEVSRDLELGFQFDVLKFLREEEGDDDQPSD